MKFLKREYDDIQKMIKLAGQDPSLFHQVKRKGHLFIERDGREDSFCFFRKKETKLTDQLKFEDQLTYFLDPKNKIFVDTWDEVLKAFEKWLVGK